MMDCFTAGQQLTATFLAQTLKGRLTVVENDLVSTYRMVVGPSRKIDGSLTIIAFENLLAPILNNVLIVSGRPQVKNEKWYRHGYDQVLHALSAAGMNGKDIINKEVENGYEVKYSLSDNDDPIMGMPITPTGVVTRYYKQSGAHLVVDVACAKQIFQVVNIQGRIKFNLINVVGTPTGAAATVGDINIGEIAYAFVHSHLLNILTIDTNDGNGMRPIIAGTVYDVKGELTINSTDAWVGGLSITGEILNSPHPSADLSRHPLIDGLRSIWEIGDENKYDFLLPFFQALGQSGTNFDFSVLLNLPPFMRKIAVKSIIAYLKYPA